MVLQKSEGICDGSRFRLLLSFGCHSKQFSDESRLTGALSFAHSLHLVFSHPRHDLISLLGSPCSLDRKGAHCGLDKLFDEADTFLNDGTKAFLGNFLGAFKTWIEKLA